MECWQEALREDSQDAYGVPADFGARTGNSCDAQCGRVNERSGNSRK